MVSIPQAIPARTCLTCEVCCRFPEVDSFLRPYFTAAEIRVAVARGISKQFFSDERGCQIAVVPHPLGAGYLCPAFDSTTSHCQIYDVRPLDCQLYPFVVMWDAEHRTVVLGWDTKCPFLMERGVPHTDRSCRHDGDIDNLVLSAELQKMADAVAARLEDSAIREVIASHPRLIGRFQDDVVVIRPLESLTRRISESML